MFCPKLEEQRAFQYENVAVTGAAQPEENALEPVLDEDQSEIHVALAREVRELLADGSWEIPLEPVWSFGGLCCFVSDEYRFGVCTQPRHKPSEQKRGGQRSRNLRGKEEWHVGWSDSRERIGQSPRNSHGRISEGSGGSKPVRGSDVGCDGERGCIGFCPCVAPDHG